MPSNLFALDSELPSLSGKESPQEQIRKMFNYLVQQKQSLQYLLRNLTADNFNASALETLTSGAKVELSDQLNMMQTALAQLSIKVDALSARVGGAEELAGRLNTLEENDELLAAEIAATQEAISALEASVAALSILMDPENGVPARLEQAEQKLDVLTVAEDGTISLGAEGTELRLVGRVIINGMVYEGGTANETA